MRVKASGIILTLALIFAITLGFIPGINMTFEVHAADASGVCSSCGNIAWKLESGTLTVSKASGATSGNMCDSCKDEWSGSSFTKVIFASGVTSISDSAFSGNDVIESVVISGDVKSIGKEAFFRCFALSNLTLSEGLTDIGGYAFGLCSQLTDLTIPSTVKSIGEYAFTYCSGLPSIAIPDGITRIELEAFRGCQGAKEVVIPDSVTYIGNWAFGNCNSLEKVTMSENVTHIGNFAFAHCGQLKSIEFPNSLTYLGSLMFMKSGITDFTIPGSVTNLGNCLFSECSSLKSLNVPCGLKWEIERDNGVLAEIACEPVVTYIHPATTCTANDTTDTITGECTCGEKTYTATLKAPTKATYTGKAIEATCVGSDDGFAPSITYSGNKLVDGKPVLPGTYIATLTYLCGTKTSVSLKYTITEAAAPAKPNKITNVVSGVHVYWPAVSGVSKYGLWRSETGVNGTYKWIANPTVAHFTDTKVTSGKTYYYKVTTLDTVNNVHSAKSAAIGITYVATPDITSRANQATGVKLGWNKIVGATGYAIYRKPYSGNAAWERVGTVDSPNTLTWTDSSVRTNNGGMYRYTIRALTGSNSKTLSGCRGDGRTMVRLTSRTLSSATKANATSIKCSWNTTAQATGYQVRFMVGSTVYKTFTVGNYKTGVKTFTGLKTGQTYKIQVRTYKKVAGVGEFYSAWSTAKTVSL